MTKFQVLDTNKVMTEDEIAQFIIDESRRVSLKYSLNYNVDKDEMESFMVSEIYNEIIKKPNFANIKGIRHLANLRCVDYIREQVKFNSESSFTAMTSAHHNADECDIFEYGWEDRSIEPHDEFSNSIEMNSFLDSLPEKERKILELSAGITDSLTFDEKVNVKKLIDNKGEGAWLTATDMGEILNIHRNTVRNTLKRMKEKALDSGLWF